MSGYDLAVAYRIYPQVAKPAIGLPFTADKLELSEICLRSFKESLGSLKIKLWVLLDGCPEEYAQLFRKYFDDEDLVLISLRNLGNRATFDKQIELLLEQQDSEVVYFAEDDYFYLPGRFSSMINFLLMHQDVHFISPYDHLDCYRLELHHEPKWLRVHGGRHWRTAASTCLTFLTTREILRKTADSFRTYNRGNDDCSLWLGLTKDRVLSPRFFFGHLHRPPRFSKYIVKSWFYHWRQILFGKKWMLWVPIPGVATHLNKQALSPNVDWRELMHQIRSQLVEEIPAVKHN